MGELVPDSYTTKENIQQKISKRDFLITVGDATTEKMIKFGLEPSLQIVDAKEKRARRSLPSGHTGLTLYCKNPPAEITDESITVIKEALGKKEAVRIVIDGEEDLLVLPVMLYAPENSIVMYGQPNEGLVIVKVNDMTRNRAKEILGQMV